jgi:hypothetical protein
MKAQKQLLVVAGLLSFAVSVFQAVVTFSPSWSKYFGAPNEVAANVPLLYALGFAAAVIFAIFGLYAISGAGYIRPLPWLRLGLVGIGTVYVMRGLWALPILCMQMGYLQLNDLMIERTEPASSLISLFIGIIYLTGTISAWRNLQILKGKRIR